MIICICEELVVGQRNSNQFKLPLITSSLSAKTMISSAYIDSKAGSKLWKRPVLGLESATTSVEQCLLLAYLCSLKRQAVIAEARA